MAEERIVVFTKNWLGDVIFEEPFIRALKNKFPSAQIICITNPRCKEILEANPHVDEVVLYDDRKKDRGITGKIKLMLLLRKKKITKAFILHRSFSRACVLFCSGIPMRIGYGTKGRGIVLTHSLCEPQEKLHRVDYFLNILTSLSWCRNDRTERYRFYVTENDIAYAKTILAEQGLSPNNIIAINPGANWGKKRWPITHFVRLIEMLNITYAIPVIITGSSVDTALAEHIRDGIVTQKPVNMCGKTSLRQLGAVFSLSRLVVSADSGPLHIASGVGAPVIALFGPTDSAETGPRGIGTIHLIQHVPKTCSVPCYDQQCSHTACMHEIEPERVMNIITDNKLL